MACNALNISPITTTAAKKSPPSCPLSGEPCPSPSVPGASNGSHRLFLFAVLSSCLKIKVSSGVTTASIRASCFSVGTLSISANQWHTPTERA